MNRPRIRILRVMIRFARLTMLVAGFLALQVSALGGGVACLLSASVVPGEAAGVGMAAMTVARPQQRGAERSAGRMVGAAEPGQTPTQAPCQQSRSSQSSCQSMAPCVAAFIPVVTVQEAVAVSPSAMQIAMADVTPTSHSRAPDIPPPRA